MKRNLIKTYQHITTEFEPQIWSTSNKDRLFHYLWYDKKQPNECKYGQRYVFAGKDPVKDCQKRIYDSLQVLKYHAIRGDIVLAAIYDVTELAKQDGEFSKKSKYDDTIRNQIGYVLHSELHSLTATGFAIKLHELFAKRQAGKISAKLSTAQYIGVEQTIESLKKNDVVLLNQCGRYGKTITSPIPAIEADRPLVIVSSYVKTSFVSFIRDISTFKNFDNFVYVDTQDKDYKTKINKALKNGRQVMAFVSLCFSNKRKERVDFLMNKRIKKHLIVDEADYGAHRPNQSKLLLESYKRNKSNSKVLLMTGTNPDRACSLWPVEDTISTTYPELVLYKKYSLKYKKKLINNTLKHFEWDSERDNLICDLEMYQADMGVVADKTIASGEVSKDFKNLPNWSAASENAQLNKLVWINIFDALKNGIYPQLNVDSQTQRFSTDKPKVEMMFVSANNNNLKLIDRIAKDTLSKYNTKVITLCGAMKYNGKRIKQENVEKIVSQFVNESLEKDENVFIISNIMAQRSFSIPEIENLYLAYDKGEKGSTIQKISRVLTSWFLGKIGRVISLSFDPNRDDKFIDLFVESATSMLKTNKNIKSLSQAMNEILLIIPKYLFGKDGKRVELNLDSYMKRLMADNGLQKVFGRTTDITKLSLDEKIQIAEGMSYTQDKTSSVKKGKAKDNTNQLKRKLTQKKIQSLDNKVRSVLVNVFQNLPELIYYSGKKTLEEAILFCKKDKDAREGIQRTFNIEASMIHDLYKKGVINNDHASMLYDMREKYVKGVT